MADKDLKNLGKHVRTLRKRAELSQLDMTQYGFSLSHFQKIERGALDPRFSALKKLAKTFGVPLSELVTV